MEQLAFDQVAAAGTVLCSCGCSAPTPIARYTDKRTGIVKGEPTRCIVGHGSRKRIDDSGRECGKCGGYKPWEDFYVDRAGVNGRSNSCKLCAQVRNADNTGAGSGPKPQGRIDDQAESVPSATPTGRGATSPTTSPASGDMDQHAGSV